MLEHVWVLGEKMDLYQQLLLEVNMLMRSYFSFREKIVKSMLRPSCFVYVSLQERIASCVDVVDTSTKELEDFYEYFNFLEETGMYFSMEDLSLEFQYYVMNYILEQNYFSDLVTYMEALSIPEEVDFISEEFLEQNEKNSKFYLEKIEENQKCLQIIRKERSDIFE